MSFRTSGNITVATILMLLAGVSADNWRCWSVTYYSQTICSLIGSSVDLHCYYTYPNNQKVTKSFWFITEQQVGVEAVDVREEEEYEGRVQYRQSSQNDCSMTITHLRESDAHTYRFRFHTDSTAGKYTGRPGVSLSVTDLKITVSDRSSRKHLICSSTCTLPNNPTYIWYRNGQPLYNQNTNGLYVYDSSEDAGSYSCAVRGYEELRSPAVCVSADNWRCWSVTYYSQTICSLIGSSVDLHCYYTYPNNQKVTKSFWFITEQQVGVEAVDVREEEEYEGRVQYRQSSQNDCSMTITHLRESDAHTYRFRFHTDSTAGKYTGRPGVSLSVTDLKITVSDRSSRKHLICSSTCTLPNNPTYIWYRNGQPLYNQNTNGLPSQCPVCY
ncbi:uncharacterized protein LOC118240485 [Electrophorus electricus]|uniref:uncharacterized protein LOC118240485 n=1 Tax=Electrophorus electricus TaxID=8005 RepID=UPI0015CFC16F|nr:uncharacterized protein LOC118240485 [Electrophorus electricus]